MKSLLVWLTLFAAFTLVSSDSPKRWSRRRCAVGGKFCSLNKNTLLFKMPLNTTSLVPDMKKCMRNCRLMPYGQYAFMGEKDCFCFSKCYEPISVSPKPLGAEGGNFFLYSIWKDPSGMCPQVNENTWQYQKGPYGRRQK